jgi:hypothetical protein
VSHDASYATSGGAEPLDGSMSDGSVSDGDTAEINTAGGDVTDGAM